MPWRPPLRPIPPAPLSLEPLQSVFPPRPAQDRSGPAGSALPFVPLTSSAETLGYQVFHTKDHFSRIQRKMKNGWCWWGGRPWPPLAGGHGGPPLRIFHIKVAIKKGHNCRDASACWRTPGYKKIADWLRFCIRTIDSAGIGQVVAGKGTAGTAKKSTGLWICSP